MANHKSAKKASRQQKKREIHNRALRSEARTALKKVRHELEGSKKVSADKIGPLFTHAQSKLMKLVSKGIVKKATASRTLSRLSSAIHKAS